MMLLMDATALRCRVSDSAKLHKKTEIERMYDKMCTNLFNLSSGSHIVRVGRERNGIL